MLPVAASLSTEINKLVLALTGVDKLEKGRHDDHQLELAARRQLFQLKTPLGLGIAYLPQHAYAAWMGSMAQSAGAVQQAMAAVFDKTLEEIDNLDKFEGTTYEWEYEKARRYLLERVPLLEDEKLGNDGVPLVPTTLAKAVSLFAAHPDLAAHVQASLTKLLDAAAEKLIEEDEALASPPDQALVRSRTKSRTNLYPGRWLYSPYAAARLTRGLAQIGLQRYFGYNVAPNFYSRPKGAWKCFGCGDMVSADENAHYDGCVKLKAAEAGQRHGGVCKAIMRACKHNNVPYSTEYHLQSGKRSDIHLALDGMAYHLDVTIVCPQSDSHAQQPDPTNAANKIKISKYTLECMASGEPFIPMAFATTGAMPAVADWLLTLIAEAGVANDSPDAVTARQIRDDVALQIAVGTALVNQAGIHRSYGFKTAVPAQHGPKRRAPNPPEDDPVHDEEHG